MRIVCGRRRSVDLVLLTVFLLLHLACCFAHSHGGHHHKGSWRLKHLGRRSHGRHRRKDASLHHHHQHHHHHHSSPSSFLSPAAAAPASASVSSSETPPIFDPTSPTHIKAQLGSNAYLPCKIRNLGNKSVSWVRNQDAHILSVDRYIFIADERFAAWHQAVTDTWTLQVKYVEAGDAGRYECQVSTEPKMSHFVHLEVVSPRVTIPGGGSELHVRSGSPVTIKCVVSHALHPPSYFFWYHGDQRIPESSWTGVSPAAVEEVSGGASVASLTIAAVTHAHAGNYTCSPAALTSASVTLHVLNGERPAAMQHGTSDSSRVLPPFLTLLVMLFLTPTTLLLQPPSSRQHR